MYKKILLILDYSESSCKALDTAAFIAGKLGSEITILVIAKKELFQFSYLEEGFTFALKDTINHQDELRSKCRNILSDAYDKIKSSHPNLNVNTMLREGKFSSTIVDLAEKDGYDLVVIGISRFEGILRWITGNNYLAVVDSCTKPVLIIKK